MKHHAILLSIGFSLFFLTGCAAKQTPGKTSPFFTGLAELYPSDTAHKYRLKIETGDYKGLTLMIVLSPRPLQQGFDLQNCGTISADNAQNLQGSRKALCAYHLRFLHKISKINLEFSPYRLDKPLSKKEREYLINKKAIGAVYIKRVSTAVQAGGLDDRHDVSESVQTWFLPFIDELKCNWGGMEVEQWAKPERGKFPGSLGLANIDMTKKSAFLDSSLVGGYVFSGNYRYNILDHLPQLILSFP